MNKLTYLFIFIAILIACKEKTTITESEGTFADPAIVGISNKIKSEPNNHSLKYERAKMFYDRESYDNAIQDLKAAMSIDSMQPDYFHLLADCYLDYYRSKEAINTLKKCLVFFPDRTETLLKLSEFYFILKKNDESISNVNVILRDYPQNAEAYFMLGLNFRSAKDTARAINSFQRAVELDADLTDGWIILGNLFEEKKNKIAERYYKSAVRTNESSVKAKHGLAMYYQNQNRIAEAIEIYDDIILIDQNYYPAYLNSGILQLDQDSIAKAIETFNLLTKIDPANSVAKFYLGLCSEIRGDTSSAIQYYEQALQLDPSYTNASKQLRSLQK